MTEKKFIADFRENFHKTFGYYPLVITKNVNVIPYMSLGELKRHFVDLGIDIEAKNSRRENTENRCIFSYIAKEMDYTLEEIGKQMGNKDHTTVRHSIITFHNMIGTLDSFKGKFEEIYRAIKEKKENDIRNSQIHQM
jgi:hypothetical protein